MSVVCIRGAITVEKNDKEEIYNASYRMIKEIIERNNLNIDDIISVIFTATKDLDQAYPAVSARKLGIVDASLMCVQELYVEGSLNMVIRASLMAESSLKQKEVRHVYLERAAVLRPVSYTHLNLLIESQFKNWR